MRNINIQVHENHTVDFENGYAGLNLENLQGNITFNFDNFISGNARVETIINNQDGYILVDQVGQTYTLPIKSSLLTGDSILMQLVIEETDKTKFNLTTDTDINTNKTYYIKVGNSYEVVEQPVKADLGTYYEADTPIWKSEVFYLKVGTSINATTTIPEDYPSWTETINNLITETENAIERAENVNIAATQTEDGAEITVTNQEGQQTTVEIKNGEKGEQGEKGDPGAIKMIIVAELPSTGADDTIYLVPLENPTETGNNYAEYVYINNAWELLGKIGVHVDLTDYVKNTDYATSQKGGVFKSGGFGLLINQYGQLYAEVINYSNYGNTTDWTFIGKKTLENVITGKGLVSNTNYANYSTGGVVRSEQFGFKMTQTGFPFAETITNANYQTANNATFISKGTLDNVLTATIGDISSVIDSINGEVI